MAVTLYIGTQMGAQKQLKPLCRLKQEHLGVGHKGGWYVELHRPIKDWAKKNKMTYTMHIVSQWEAGLVIDDPRLATLFKLTWM